MNEQDTVIGYKNPPRSTRYRPGVSGSPKGRPKRKGKGLPYARIPDRRVTVKEGLGAPQVTAEEGFILYLRKKALDGKKAAQGRLEEIQALRRALALEDFPSPAAWRRCPWQ
jgi:hypothetical protein